MSAVEHEIVCGRRNQLAAGVVSDLAAYRYDIFVRRLKWDLPRSRVGWEEDEFDTDDAVYLIARNLGKVSGCGRLLPTIQPYLLQEVFPYLAGPGGPPASPRIWELSRFAAVPPSSSAAACSPDLAPDLFARACKTAVELGAEQLIGVLTVSVERALQRFARLERLGSPKLVNGQWLVACHADVRDEVVLDVASLGVSSLSATRDCHHHPRP